jgi:LPS-assembly protein
VQLYFGNSTLEADRVIYDQKTKRLHAEGNVTLTQGDGSVTHGEIMDLSDDYRDGFVDSLRLDAPEADPIRRRARGAVERQFHGLPQRRLYRLRAVPGRSEETAEMAGEGRADHPRSGREDALFRGRPARVPRRPMAYFPYMSAPDPTVKRKTGVLTPSYSTSSVYGVGVAVPYYWALAPDYDFTLTPMITSRQGPLLQGEWRQRVFNGAYNIRATGLFQLDKDVFVQNGVATPGYRDWRGSIESAGQFNLSDKWVWGWNGTAAVGQELSVRLRPPQERADRAICSRSLRPTTPCPSSILAGRGDRSYFDARTMYFYGLSPVDVQGQLPVVHPVIDHDYVFKNPIFGGELSFHNNLTSLSRDTGQLRRRSRRRPSPATCAR